MTPVYLDLSIPAGEMKPGSSRFWGKPDMPCGMLYPSYKDSSGEEHPYFFVCQINLDDVSVYDVGNMLPHEGVLSFFARIDHYLGYYDTDDFIGGSVSGPDAVKVLYFPSDANLAETGSPSESRPAYIPRALQISFSHSPASPFGGHALFAPPTHRQWETWDPPFEDNIILLEIDSFSGDGFDLSFMDEGVLDLLVSPSDLGRHCFSDVRAIVLSS